MNFKLFFEKNTKIFKFFSRKPLKKLVLNYRTLSTITILLLLVAIIVLLCMYFLCKLDHSKSGDNSANPVVCSTPECVKASQLLLNTMDLTVDPCSNFMDYACGKFYNSHYVTKTKPVASIITVTTQAFYREIIALIHNNPLKSTDPLEDKQIKISYGNCIERNVTRELETFLLAANRFGYWPLWRNIVSSMLLDGLTTDKDNIKPPFDLTDLVLSNAGHLLLDIYQIEDIESVRCTFFQTLFCTFSVLFSVLFLYFFCMFLCIFLKNFWYTLLYFFWTFVYFSKDIRIRWRNNIFGGC